MATANYGKWVMTFDPPRRLPETKDGYTSKADALDARGDVYYRQVVRPDRLLVGQNRFQTKLMNLTCIGPPHSPLVPDEKPKGLADAVRLYKERADELWMTEMKINPGGQLLVNHQKFLQLIAKRDEICHPERFGRCKYRWLCHVKGYHADCTARERPASRSRTVQDGWRAQCKKESLAKKTFQAKVAESVRKQKEEDAAAHEQVCEKFRQIQDACKAKGDLILLQQGQMHKAGMQTASTHDVRRWRVGQRSMRASSKMQEGESANCKTTDSSYPGIPRESERPWIAETEVVKAAYPAKIASPGRQAGSCDADNVVRIFIGEVPLTIPDTTGQTHPRRPGRSSTSSVVDFSPSCKDYKSRDDMGISESRDVASTTSSQSVSTISLNGYTSDSHLAGKVATSNAVVGQSSSPTSRSLRADDKDLISQPHFSTSASQSTSKRLPWAALAAADTGELFDIASDREQRPSNSSTKTPEASTARQSAEKKISKAKLTPADAAESPRTHASAVESRRTSASTAGDHTIDAEDHTGVAEELAQPENAPLRDKVPRRAWT